MKRVCTGCGVEKPEEAFRLRKSTSTGRHYRGKKCRACHQARSTKWRKENPSLVRKYNEAQRVKPGAREKNNKRAIESHFRRKFNLTIAERDAMLAAQGGRCMVCGTDKPRGKGWCVDHNHKTNEVRAILCSSCNIVIGHAQENADILRAAADYIEVHS